MLTVEKHDKMFRDLRNSKGSRELSARSVWIQVSGYNLSVSNLEFSLYVGELGQGTRYSNVTSSLLPQLTHLVEATITCRLAIPLLNTASRLSVPSQILFSITFVL